MFLLNNKKIDVWINVKKCFCFYSKIESEAKSPHKKKKKTFKTLK